MNLTSNLHNKSDFNPSQKLPKIAKEVFNNSSNRLNEINLKYSRTEKLNFRNKMFQETNNSLNTNDYFYRSQSNYIYDLCKRFKSDK